MSNQKPTSVLRLQKDYMRIKRDPIPYITAEPLPQNILEWHYVIRGPVDTPFDGGYYHGTLQFPVEFPFKPPAIFMITPNGRFKTNTRLCLSISDFHPDTWNPAWSVATILTGLLSFMLETTPTLGSIECTQYERIQYAQNSLKFNMKNHVFCKLFPGIVIEMKKRLNLLQHSNDIVDNVDMVDNIDTNQIKSNNKKLKSHLNKTTDNKYCINNINHNHNNKKQQQSNINSNRNDKRIMNNNNNLRQSCDKSLCQSSTSSTIDAIQSTSKWHALAYNLFVIIGFILFAIIVNYVINGLSGE